MVTKLNTSNYYIDPILMNENINDDRKKRTLDPVPDQLSILVPPNHPGSIRHIWKSEMVTSSSGPGQIAIGAKNVRLKKCSK